MHVLLKDLYLDATVAITTKRAATAGVDYCSSNRAAAVLLAVQDDSK